MIFAHTIDKVLAGTKTQTRRIVKPNSAIVNRDGVIHEVVDGSISRRTPTYAVGKTYAVQPGRGKRAVARIRIERIWREDVREISDADVKAEGFGDDGLHSKLDFLSVWASMHDKEFTFMRNEEYWDFDGTWSYPTPKGSQFADSLVMAYEVHQRPAARYDAWAIAFCLEDAA